jgi:translation elongation factor P/translation initiation factor 5A
MAVVPGLSKWLFRLTLICIALLIIGGIASTTIFNAGRFSSLMNPAECDFTDAIADTDDISDIALMDTDSAKIIGDRAIGSLADVVSQYQVSDSYSTIDLNGSPMKVASLEYADFFKYVNNYKNGIPGYVLVDPVKNEAKYVKLDKPIKYTKSGCFNDNLERHVQLSYPTKIFEGYYLELDNDGNPYYICPTMKANAGIFGAKDVEGVVICDPCTGDTAYYDLADVPGWVDRVYDGSLACKKYDWYGTLSGGFINSVIGNKGCKQTTDDYGYKVIDGDVWIYTGVTSVNGDESNIGFILSNLRTGETKYFAIAGAEEYSAMSSAEGQVQHLGYTASFPSLINIQSVPTYIMVLKDNAGLVKMYALVNIEKYNIVATGSTQKEALSEYKKLLAQNGIELTGKAAETDYDAMGIKTAQITVKDIKFIAIDGDTVVYITDEKDNVYKQDFAENELLIRIQTGDKITLHYYDGEDEIYEIYDYADSND